MNRNREAVFCFRFMDRFPKFDGGRYTRLEALKSQCGIWLLFPRRKTESFINKKINSRCWKWDLEVNPKRDLMRKTMTTGFCVHFFSFTPNKDAASARKRNSS